MFQDRKKELQRLEEALLKDRELFDPELPDEFEEDLGEDTPPEEFDEELFEDTVRIPEVWNTDSADADLDELSREVYDAPRPRSTGLLGFATAVLILAAILGWLVLKERGMLP